MATILCAATEPCSPLTCESNAASAACNHMSTVPFSAYGRGVLLTVLMALPCNVQLRPAVSALTTAAKVKDTVTGQPTEKGATTA